MRAWLDRDWRKSHGRRGDLPSGLALRSTSNTCLSVPHELLFALRVTSRDPCQAIPFQQRSLALCGDSREGKVQYRGSRTQSKKGPESRHAEPIKYFDNKRRLHPKLLFYIKPSNCTHQDNGIQPKYNETRAYDRASIFPSSKLPIMLMRINSFTRRLGASVMYL